MNNSNLLPSGTLKFLDELPTPIYMSGVAPAPAPAPVAPAPVTPVGSGGGGLTPEQTSPL